MDVIFFVVLIAAIMVPAICSVFYADASEWGFFAVGALVGAVLVIGIAKGRVVDVRTEVRYRPEAVYYGDTGIVFSSETAMWWGLYNYHVPCEDLRNGCPDKLPSVFSFFETNDGELVIAAPREH